MGDILNASNHKMATIGEDGKVRNTGGIVIGRVADDARAYNNTGVAVGYYDSNGYVYKGGSHIGTVRSDGKVYDYEDHYIGKVVGDHIESGGAALLLLVR